MDERAPKPAKRGAQNAMAEKSTTHDEAAIDLERYPIDRLDDKRSRQIVARCRSELAEVGCCSLPGFVTASALGRMTQECRAVSARAHHLSERVNAYFSAPDPDLPAGHPRNLFMTRTSGFVPADALPSRSSLRAIYDHPAFMPFVQACLDERELFRYADPLADVIVNVVRPGESFPWHFDTNEFSVSILTQAADEGGLFEFVPNLRSGEDENFPAVKAILDGGDGPVRRLNLKPGDLQIFRGRYSLHRVTEVSGRHPRFTAIYSYAKRPGMVGRVARTKQLYGKVLPIHLEAERRATRADALID